MRGYTERYKGEQDVEPTPEQEISERLDPGGIVVNGMAIPQQRGRFVLGHLWLKESEQSERMAHTVVGSDRGIYEKGGSAKPQHPLLAAGAAPRHHVRMYVVYPI